MGQKNSKNNFDINFNNKEKLPEWVDLRSKSGCPDVLNQLSLNISSANAISNVIRYTQRKNKQQEFQPSRLYIYYFGKLIQKNNNVTLKNLLKGIKKYGLCPEKYWPYIDVNENHVISPTEGTIEFAKQYDLTNFKYFSLKNNIEHLKYALYLKYPIIFVMRKYESFDDEIVKTKGVVSMPKKNERILGHITVSIYGYRNSSKTFICMNSVGKEWGERGFFYLPYKYITKYCYDFWIINI